MLALVNNLFASNNILSLISSPAVYPVSPDIMHSDGWVLRKEGLHIPLGV
jgi:hypothetical protein